MKKKDDNYTTIEYLVALGVLVFLGLLIFIASHFLIKYW